MKKIEITTIPGFLFGQYESTDGHTGCTVIIHKDGVKAGVDVRGGAPGTRETDVMTSENYVQKIHGIFLSGGSAFGLDVGSGVMKLLEEEKIGFDVGMTQIPIVPGAILFDLHHEHHQIRPDATMGYKAAKNALRCSLLKQGNYGAGAGASVGKALGAEYSMKGGIGYHAFQVGSVQVGAIVAVNCFGDIIDPQRGHIIAGLQEQGRFLNSETLLMKEIMRKQTNRFAGNTTIGAVITNADVSKPQANKLASISHNGLARTIRPSHTFVDGDTMFFMSTGEVPCDLNSLSVMAVKAVEQAILNAVFHAESTSTLIAAKDLMQ
ncbi:L-aminopeptidase/D-esterase [Halobacillus karajensis]|uniref:L-aminopeptidase/D-esterase n=1 Tax=Halobacillus karajensis TaxID=195088 RepID=A0A024P2B1_9BACI|nr:P1 family peptidase [Halobacillus karajensis]CDQ19579.1 L-aminopeptidase/D-esterase [Halobacillus karajensis]CDQ22041.1 L-aminopeptidase/D-esterase [Halobacillus karajensis]CDQ27882.1 L-aminopeptidase/D-esterase [Halobacillus karajensis]SEH79988.1 L-aminopeptidase/D-esterase [Halobacillus karajensis]